MDNTTLRNRLLVSEQHLPHYFPNSWYFQGCYLTGLFNLFNLNSGWRKSGWIDGRMDRQLMQDWFMDSQFLTFGLWANRDCAGVRMQEAQCKRNNALLETRRFQVVWSPRQHSAECGHLLAISVPLWIYLFRMLCCLPTAMMTQEYTWKYHRPGDLPLEAKWSTNMFSSFNLLPQSINNKYLGMIITLKLKLWA